MKKAPRGAFFQRLAERDIRDLIFGFEGMTNAFRDVVASGKVLRKNRRFFYSSPIGESIVCR